MLTHSLYGSENLQSKFEQATTTRRTSLELQELLATTIQGVIQAAFEIGYRFWALENLHLHLE